MGRTNTYFSVIIHIAFAYSYHPCFIMQRTMLMITIQSHNDILLGIINQMQNVLQPARAVCHLGANS